MALNLAYKRGYLVVRSVRLLGFLGSTKFEQARLDKV